MDKVIGFKKLQKSLENDIFLHWLVSISSGEGKYETVSHFLFGPETKGFLLRDKLIRLIHMDGHCLTLNVILSA